MTDITKCADHACPSRESCWRFSAPAKWEQSFANFGRHVGEIRCGYYLHVTPIDKRRKQNAVRGNVL